MHKHDITFKYRITTDNNTIYIKKKIPSFMKHFIWLLYLPELCSPKNLQLSKNITVDRNITISKQD